MHLCLNIVIRRTKINTSYNTCVNVVHMHTFFLWNERNPRTMENVFTHIAKQVVTIKASLCLRKYQMLTQT